MSGTGDVSELSQAKDSRTRCLNCWNGKVIPCAVGCRAWDECCGKQLHGPCVACDGSGWVAGWVVGGVSDRGRESLFDARQMALAPDFVTLPDRIVRRGGRGPEQPEWNDVQTYSAEWYRRFRDWHQVEFPDADQVTRNNLNALVEMSERG